MGHGWGMGFSIWCILIVIGFILFYFLKGHTNKGYSSAQDILDRRYANGEINTEEYEEKSNILKKIG
jgi:putative membrane protein